jgi:O-antigen ligase
MPAAPSKSPEKKISATEIYSAIFGLFLGLAIWKFGNPVVLEQIIHPPANWQNFWNDAWPIAWANALLIIITIVGGVLLLANPFRWPATRWLWLLPLIWLAWQFLSAAQSQFQDLTTPTLWQYAGCVICYFLGALVIGRQRRWQLLLIGVFAALAFCLVRAVDQKLFEFPREKQMLIESQQTGWTNMAPSLFLELEQDHVIINTNGIDIANPVILAKYEKGRVSGTLVYPNALAGIVLLLLPAALALIWQITRNMRSLVCFAAMGLSVFLGLAGLFWSGSKSGWLIALAIGVFWLLRLNWSRQLKWLVVIAIVGGGLAVFGLRFHSYFAKGATSVSARFDYWHAAARTALDHPGLGTGPGTFQRPYAQLKRPESEMARLVHNDYLEQFSDSGLIGGLAYVAWLGLLLWTIGCSAWMKMDWVEFAIFAGLLAWFLQGFIEFGLFIPALAWTAFTLAGCLLARPRNEFDKPAHPV